MSSLPSPLPSPARHREALVLLLLVVAILATRMPFLMHGLDEWDTANFALSLLKFDVMADQPHAPGQFLYVRLLQGINLLTGGNELRTLTLASAVCSTLALLPLYAVLRQVFRPAVAFAAVALTASTFGYWITSLRMISDPVACLFVAGAVAALLAGLTNGRWYLVGMVVCALALGFKQTSMYFLAPFALVVNVIMAVRAGIFLPLVGSLLFAGTVAGWLAPTVHNAGGWAPYVARCAEKQRENHDVESIIFHLSSGVAKIQADQNLVQPWGAIPLAVVMLTLAVAGLVPLCRRNLPGKLFALYGLTVVFYAFFFLYRFNKYYVYSVPFLCSLAVVALFALGAWLARRTGQARWADGLPVVAVAGLVGVNVALTAPLLRAISHFRAPPQAALEALHALRPGAGARPLLLTDDITTGRQLYYFHLKERVALVNCARDLTPAVSALNAARAVYFLTPTEFDVPTSGGGQVRKLGRYEWPAFLYEPLQGRPDLRGLNLYELATPLPAEYRFADAAHRPPLLAKGMWEDGWCGSRTELLLPCPDPSEAEKSEGGERSADYVELRGTVLESFAFTFPYQLTFSFGGDSTPQKVNIERPGPFNVVLPLPHPPGARAVEMEFTAPQTFRPGQHNPGVTDQRELSVHLDSVRAARRPAGVFVQADQGWHVPEGDGTIRWRWTSATEATFTVQADRAGTLVMETTARTATPDNALEVLLDGQPVGDAVPLPLVGPWETLGFRVPVTAGAHRLTLRSRRPGVQPPGDGRTLTLCVRDPQWRLDP